MRAGGPDRSRPRSPGLAGLPAFLGRLWQRWALAGADVDVLVVASRGVWTRAERSSQARRLRALARHVRVISDAEAAYRGALGDAPGMLLLAGTGSMALGRDRRGRWARAGGLGPLLGDEGSAFWIGREWLRTSTRARGFLATRRLLRSPDPVAANRRGCARRPAPRPSRVVTLRARHRHARPGRPRRPARHDGAPPSPPPAHRGELERLAARRCRLPGRRLARGPAARPRPDPETSARERRPGGPGARPSPPEPPRRF